MRNVKKQHVGYHLDPSSLYNLPIQAHIYWKDLDGHYLDSNDVMLEHFCIDSRQDLQGKTDLDFPVLKDEALSYQEEDKLVIAHGKTLQFLNRGTLPNSTIEFVGVKTPIFDSEKNITGVFGFSYFFDKIEECNLSKNFITYDFRKTNPLKEHKDALFSKRQIDILKILCRGKTAKEIAQELDLSPRTVEFYIENIKNKINVSTKSELIIAILTQYPHLL